MALQSQLFSNDPRLEAAATSDPAHIVPNASGPHVGKIQVALLHLDGAVIESDELLRLVYGPSTARAVLAYKKKRDIVNRSYQNQADNVVGKMTMAALDREMRQKEPLSGPTRIRPLTAMRKARLSFAAPAPANSLVAFNLGSGSLVGGPQIVIPNSPRLPGLFMELSVGAVGRFQVINGKGGTVGCADNSIALVSDPAEPLAHSGNVPVFKEPHVFDLKGVAPGRTLIVATDKSRKGFGDMMSVKVKARLPAREVTIAFHFLGGPPAVASQRDRNSLASAIATMNDIYEIQTGITFRMVASSSAPLIVPEFANQQQALVFLKSKRTPDWEAITQHRLNTAHFNVFFARKIEVLDDSAFAGSSIALTDTAGKPEFKSRDCVAQDNLKGIELGLTLAHEAGHALGEDDNKEPGHLLNAGAPGRHIPAGAAARMNTHAGTL